MDIDYCSCKQVDNKVKIAEAGGIEPLVGLLRVSNIPVAIEAAAALANLAVNGMSLEKNKIKKKREREKAIFLYQIKVD